MNSIPGRLVRVIKSRRMKWAGHMARMGEERGVYRVLVGKPEGRRPLGRPRRRWVDNIRMELQEVGCGYMDTIGLAQDRDRWRTLLSAVMNLRVPWNAGNFLTSCFSRRTLHHGVSTYTWPPQAGQFTHQRNGSFSIQTCGTSKTEDSNSLWKSK